MISFKVTSYPTQIFDNVRKEQVDVMRKITAVTGDVTQPGFGLSPSDLQLLIENVSVVFHSAATVKFNEELKAAMEMNVKGPMHLLEICRQMKRLEVSSSLSYHLINRSTIFYHFLSISLLHRSMSWSIHKRLLCTCRLHLTISIGMK